jgi:hypothetical protein
VYICGVENVGDNKEAQHGWMLRSLVSEVDDLNSVAHACSCESRRLTVPDYRIEINAHSFNTRPSLFVFS